MHLGRSKWKHLWEEIKIPELYIYIRFQIPEDIRQTEGKLAETISRKRSIGNSDNGIKKHKSDNWAKSENFSQGSEHCKNWPSWLKIKYFYESGK